MPCFQPRHAYRLLDGTIQLRPHPDSEQLEIACQQCLGCRATYARNWALRAQLEEQEHAHSAFTTLTLDDENLIPTLSKPLFQRFIKRLRHKTANPFRYLASGEYGEHTQRPHYHAILFGVDSALHGPTIQETWGLGITQTYKATPATIAYVAGYTAKKLDFKDKPRYKRVPEGTPDATERVDPHTGEVFYTITTYQPPFLLMSRGKHGLGGNAKQWPDMWKDHAIHNGNKIPPPRYLHEAWKQQAHPFDIEEQEYQKYKKIKHITHQEREAQEIIYRKQTELKNERKKLK